MAFALLEGWGWGLVLFCPVNFLCFVLPILFTVQLQGRGVHMREGLCGASAA